MITSVFSHTDKSYSRQKLPDGTFKMRLAEGIDLGAIAARFGYVPDALIVPDKVAFYARLGLVERAGDRLTVTPAGMPLLDALLAELVAPALVAA